MPFTGIKCTAIIKEDVFSITDTYAYNSTSFPTVYPLFLQLFKLRMLFTGPPCAAFRGRMASQPAGRIVQLLSTDDINGLPAGPATYGGPSGGGVAGDADQPKSSLQVRMQSASGQWRNTWLAGVPDVLIGEDPTGPRPTLIPAWQTAFNNWANMLTANGMGGNWGWIGRVLPGSLSIPPQPIVGFTVRQVDNLLGVVVGSNALGNVFPYGIQIRKTKMAQRGIYQANGKWDVDSVQANYPNAGQYTLWLLNSIKVNPQQVVRYGTVEIRDFTFVQINSVSIIRQTTHARGNRILTGPGRRSRPTKVLV